MVETSRNAVKEARYRVRREDNYGRRDGDGRGGDRIRTGEDKLFGIDSVLKILNERMTNLMNELMSDGGDC